MSKILVCLLGAALILAMPDSSEAQSVKRFKKPPLKDSIVDAGGKTLTWPSTLKGVTGVQATVVAGTGTVAAVGYLEVRLDTLNTTTWTRYGTLFDYPADSVIFSASTLTKIWPIPVQAFNGVRLRVTSSGTQKTYLYLAYLRW